MVFADVVLLKTGKKYGINDLEADPTRYYTLFKKLSKTIFIRFRPKGREINPT
jgi:hypothetical protein